MGKRNLDLMSRNEDTREKVKRKVVKFEMQQIRQHFEESLHAIHAQFTVADDLWNSGKKEEAENIWRAQIIFLASAFDFYMHELTKYGLCQIYEEQWDRTEKYENIQVKMKDVEEALKSGEEIDWFLEYINSYYQGMTMVSFDAVKEQCNLLGMKVPEIADKAFYKRGANEKTKEKLKRRLNELFNRRNIIAHQTDRTHEDAQRLEITKEIAAGFIKDVEQIVQAMEEEAETKTA